MAYQIRYGFDRYRQTSRNRMIRIQMLGSGILILLAGLISLLDGGAQMMRRMFCAAPVSGSEQAVAAFADCLCRGEGWYRGLVVWCRVILDGAAV